jgi:hypothetical protein
MYIALYFFSIPGACLYHNKTIEVCCNNILCIFIIKQRGLQNNENAYVIKSSRISDECF